MSPSFWIVLIASVLAFVPVWSDHGETWREFCASSGKARIKQAAKLVFILWGIPVLTLIGTLAAGLESISSEKDMSELRQSVATATTNSAIAKAEAARFEKLYDQSTNALAEAKSRLATIRPLKDRIIECLNDINPIILIELKRGNFSFNVTHTEFNITRLRSMQSEPSGSRYIIDLIIDNASMNSAEVRGRVEMVKSAKFTLSPSLLQ
jgi:hypothetical protein